MMHAKLVRPFHGSLEEQNDENNMNHEGLGY